MLRLVVSFTVNNPEPRLGLYQDKDGTGHICHVSGMFDVDAESPAVLDAIQAAVDELEANGITVDQGGYEDDAEFPGDFLYTLEFPDFQAEASDFQFVDNAAKSLIANISRRLLKI